MISPSFLAQLVKNSNTKKGEEKLSKLVSQAFFQEKIANKFLSDLQASQGLERAMKVLLYGFFAMKGGAGSAISPDQQFWAPRPGMIPEYEIYKFLGKEVKLKPKKPDKAFESLRAFFDTLYHSTDDFTSIKNKVEMQSALAKHVLVYSKDEQETIKPDREAMREVVDLLLVWAEKGSIEPIVLLSHAGKEIFDSLLKEDPFGLGEGFKDIDVRGTNPNSFRYFYPEMGMEELEAIVSVFSSINPESKANPLILKEIENGYKLIFDEDDHEKFVFIEETEWGMIARLANGNYIQPIRVVTAASQVGMITDNDVVSLDPVGSLVYYLVSYGVTSVGGRSKVDHKKLSNLDNEGFARIGEDLYKSLKDVSEKEDPEHLQIEGSHNTDVKRYYQADYIQWFANPHFYSKGSSLKFYNALSSDAGQARINIVRSKLGEFGDNSYVKVSGPSKEQMIEYCLCQGWILGTKNNTSYSAKLLTVKGEELSEEECRDLLNNMGKKGKKGLFSRMAKAEGYSLKEYLKKFGEEVLIEKIVKHKNTMVFMLSDKGGNKAIDRIRNFFALCETLHPLSQDPAGWSFDKSEVDQNTCLVIEAVKTHQLIAGGDGTVIRMPRPDGSRKTLLAQGYKKGTSNFSIEENELGMSGETIQEMVTPTTIPDNTEVEDKQLKLSYDLEVDRETLEVKGNKIAKGDVLATINIHGFDKEIVSDQHAYITGMTFYAVDDMSPRLRVKITYQTLEDAFKGRGPVKMTVIECSLEARNRLLGFNENPDDILGEFLITQQSNKATDVAYNGLADFGCTYANNRKRWDKLSENAQYINEEMAELIEEYNAKAGFPQVKDKVVITNTALAKGYHEPLVEYLDHTFGKPIWVSPDSEPKMVEALETSAMEGFSKEGKTRFVRVDESFAPEFEGFSNVRVFSSKDNPSYKDWILVFYTNEQGKRAYAQRIWTWTGSQETGKFYLPSGFEKSTVKDAVGSTNFTPNVLKNIALYGKEGQKLLEEMMIENDLKKETFNILSACDRATKLQKQAFLRGEKGEPVANDVETDCAPKVFNLAKEDDADEIRNAFLEILGYDQEEGNIPQESRQNLLTLLANNEDVATLFLALPSKKGHVYINLLGVTEVDSNRTDEKSDGLGGVLKEYLLNFLLGSKVVASPKGKVLTQLAYRIGRMLENYLQGDASQKLPFKADSGVNTRGVASPDCTVGERHILISEDPDSAWQEFRSHLRRRIASLKKLGKHKEAKEAKKVFNGNLNVLQTFLNRNPLAYTVFGRLHPVIERVNEDGEREQWKLEEDGSWTKIQYFCHKYQIKMSYWDALATRGDNDGDLYAIYYVGNHINIPDTTFEDIIKSLKESSNTDPIRDWDFEDYFSDFCDIKGSIPRGRNGFAASTQDDFIVETMRTISQWTNGVGMSYAVWTYVQSMMEVVSSLDEQAYLKIIKDKSNEASNIGFARKDNDYPALDTIAAESYEMMLSNYEQALYEFSCKTLQTKIFDMTNQAPTYWESRYAALGLNPKYSGVFKSGVNSYSMARAIFEEKSFNLGAGLQSFNIEEILECAETFSKVGLMIALVSVLSQFGSQAKLKAGQFGHKEMPNAKSFYGKKSPHMKALLWIAQNSIDPSGMEAEIPGITEELNKSFIYRWMTGIAECCFASYSGEMPEIDFSVFTFEESQEEETKEPEVSEETKEKDEIDYLIEELEAEIEQE